MVTYEESLTITAELLRAHVGRPVRASEHIQTDLGLDSLAVMEIINDLETRFDVNITSDMFDSISTVDDVARAIVKLQR